MLIQEIYKGRKNNNLKGLILTVNIFIILKHKINKIKVLEPYKFNDTYIKIVTSSCVIVICRIKIFL